MQFTGCCIVFTGTCTASRHIAASIKSWFSDDTSSKTKRPTPCPIQKRPRPRHRRCRAAAAPTCHAATRAAVFCATRLRNSAPVAPSRAIPAEGMCRPIAYESSGASTCDEMRCTAHSIHSREAHSVSARVSSVSRGARTRKATTHFPQNNACPAKPFPAKAFPANSSPANASPANAFPTNEPASRVRRSAPSQSPTPSIPDEMKR
eukprot:5583135-Pleurochrysis_carterae.AAC.2